MMVSAATPASPARRSMVVLKRKVVTLMESWAISSELPLKHTPPNSRSRMPGRVKCSGPLLYRKKHSPPREGIRKAMPVARAAPLTPMSSETMKT